MNSVFPKIAPLAILIAFTLGNYCVGQETKSSSASNTSAPAAQNGEASKIKVLIVDGQNNHGSWPKTTIMMKQFLEESGRFNVDVARTATTWKGGRLLKEFPLNDGKEYKDLQKPTADPNFSPNFQDFDVVLSNFGYNAAPWPEETKKSFEKYIANGGGLVVVHAADNSWGDWKEFNLMIGLGGWGGRNEKSGPYVYFNEVGEEIRDNSKGGGGAHGPQHEYQIVARDQDHPIMKGLPKAWLHAKDELYERLRGPAENMTILATAFADKKFRGTGRHEPMIMVLDYKDGRIFHTPMGHADYSMECVGYRTVLLRGTEWAATGKVTLTDVPENFPTDKAASQETFERKEASKTN